MDNQKSGTNIHSLIWRQHGRDVIKRLRKLEKISEKLARWRNHRHYNIRCVHSNVTPKCFHLKSPVKGDSANRLLRRTEKKLLQIAIFQCNYTIVKLEEEKQSILIEIARQTSPSVKDAILKHIDDIYEREFTDTKDKQLEKFKQLTSKVQQDTTHTINKERWVINLSKKEITETEKTILSRGLNFAVTPQRLPVDDIIATTEQACQHLSNTDAGNLRSDIVKTLQRKRRIKSNITLEERKALQDLKKCREIKILPADKGRVTVVMNSSDYHNKILALLEDTNTYEKLKSDPTTKYKNSLAKILRNLRDNDKITRNVWQKLYPTSCEIPKFYGLPKIHKKDNPLRPIVSSIGSVSYESARFLSKILGPLVGKTKHHIKNSSDLVEKIRDLEVPPPWKLVSFDVSALFTSIPINEALEVVEKKLAADETWKNNSKLSKEDIIELLQFCLKTTYFQYDSKIYSQKQGAAMSSPISPIITN